MIVPLAGGAAFFEEEDHGLDAGSLEGASGTVEHGVEVAAFEQFLAQGDGGGVGIGQEGVFNDDGGTATGTEHTDEVLEEEEGGLACFDGKVLLHFLAFLATEGGIGEDQAEFIQVFIGFVGFG